MIVFLISFKIPVTNVFLKNDRMTPSAFEENGNNWRYKM